MSLISWVNSPSGLMGSGLGLAARATILLAIVLGAWRALGRRRPLIGSAIGRGRGEPRCLLRWPIRVAAGALGLALAVALGAARITHAGPWLEPAPDADAGVSFSGRVIEKETGKPVPGATVVVTRSLVAPVQLAYFTPNCPRSAVLFSLVLMASEVCGMSVA
jgi:hypothetical protein